MKSKNDIKVSNDTTFKVHHYMIEGTEENLVQKKNISYMTIIVI